MSGFGVGIVSFVSWFWVYLVWVLYVGLVLVCFVSLFWAWFRFGKWDWFVSDFGVGLVSFVS